MTMTRAFATIICSGIAFAVGGGVIGYALARIAPSYYRSVFSGGNAINFDPAQVGVGLGVSQGLIGGLAIGSVVVLAIALSSRRHPAKEPLDLA